MCSQPAADFGWGRHYRPKRAYPRARDRRPSAPSTELNATGGWRSALRLSTRHSDTRPVLVSQGAWSGPKCAGGVMVARGRGSARAGWSFVLLGALFVSACGTTPEFARVPGAVPGSAHPSSTNWDQCLRDHGTNVPAGYNPYTSHLPKLDISSAAQSACQRYMPPEPPSLVAAGRVQLAKWSACMRRKGFQNSIWFFAGGGGIQFAHGISPSTPGFSGAMKACRKLL